jgi:hypothetical protein
MEVVMNKLERAIDVWRGQTERERARAQDSVLSMNRKYAGLDWGEYAVSITDRYVLVHAGYYGAGAVAHFEGQGVRTQDTQPYTVHQWERERCMQVFLASDFCVLYYEKEGL